MQQKSYTVVEKNNGRKKKKKFSRGWFRSIDLWVMGPARSHCATLLPVCSGYCISFIYTIYHSTVQTQAQLSHSSEKERSAVEKEMTLQSRVRTLESQLSGTKQEKSQLLASLELERAKLQTLEENQNRYVCVSISYQVCLYSIM